MSLNFWLLGLRFLQKYMVPHACTAMYCSTLSRGYPCPNRGGAMKMPVGHGAKKCLANGTKRTVVMVRTSLVLGIPSKWHKASAVAACGGA